MKLCIFEDEKCEDFYPISLTRPVFGLKLGMEELYKRDSRLLGLKVERAFCRGYLAATSRKSMGIPVNSTEGMARDDWLFLNGRSMNPIGISLDEADVAGMRGQDVAFIAASKQTVKKHLCADFKLFLEGLLKDCDRAEADTGLAAHVWDLVLRNSQAIAEDYRSFRRSGIQGEMADGSYVVGDKERVYVAPTAKVDPLVVLDAANGPIYLDEGVRVYPHTRVEGPSYIGKDSQLVGGKIREGCSIGPVCRVGGEVEESIFQGYSNKYHDGFIGHSYVGEWVNLGALTTNSDLKNDYSTVQVFLRGRLVETNLTKVGSAIGDHVKTAIGTLLNTGTVVGVMTVVMPSGEVSPKNIPSFCLLHRNQIRGGLGFDNLIETAGKAMSRRGVELGPDEIAVLKHIYDATAEERESLIRRDRRKRARS